MQVTSRLVPGLRSLRNAQELAVVREAFARSQRPGFYIVHHSIQSNHVHLIIEADDRAALSAGMRGLLVRLARALNRLWGRCGGVLADRFHERELRTPREVRNALLYVLQNARKHGLWMRGPDPCSTGREFDVWAASTDPRRAMECGRPANSARSSGQSAGPGSTSVGGVCRHARTWLLEIGWRRHGLLREGEVPQGTFGRFAARADSPASRPRVR